MLRATPMTSYWTFLTSASEFSFLSSNQLIQRNYNRIRILISLCYLEKLFILSLWSRYVNIRRNTEYSLFIRAETLISEEMTRVNSDYLILHRKGKNGSTFPSFLRVMNLHIIMIINIKDHPQKYCILDQN